MPAYPPTSPMCLKICKKSIPTRSTRHRLDLFPILVAVACPGQLHQHNHLHKIRPRNYGLQTFLDLDAEYVHTLRGDSGVVEHDCVFHVFHFEYLAIRHLELASALLRFPFRALPCSFESGRRDSVVESWPETLCMLGKEMLRV